MKRPFQKNNPSILYQLCVSFVLILSIPIITWSVLYSHMRTVITDNAVDYNSLMVDSSIKNMQDITNQINYNNIQLSLNRTLGSIKFFSPELNAGQVYELGQMSKELSARIASYSVIEEIYLYFPSIDYCIYSSGYLPSREFYGVFYGGQEADYQVWKADLTQSAYLRQHREVVGDFDCISFLQSFPLASKDIEVVCVSVVRERKFLEAFSSNADANHAAGFVVRDNHGSLMLQGGNDELLAIEVSEDTAPGKQTIHGREYYILQTKMSMPSWTVTTIIPMSSILTGLTTMRNWSIAVLFAYFVICVGILISLLKYNYAPVKHLLDRIADILGTAIDGSSNEYALIEQAFREISSRKQAADDLLEDQEGIVRQSFLHSLLYGNCKPEEWEKALPELGVTLAGDRFLVVLCQIEDAGRVFPDDDSLNDRERLRLGNFIIDSILSEIFAESVCVLSATINGQTAYIINIGEDMRIYETVKRCILDAQKAVAMHFDFLFAATVSDLHDTYAGICEAYEEARETMEYRILYNEGSVIRYAEVKTPQHGDYYYPFENEKVLINHIRNGDYEAAKRAMDEIYTVNFRDNQLPLTYARCLLFDMASTIIKTVNELSDTIHKSISQEDIDTLLGCENIYDMQKMMHRILKRVCEYVDAQTDVRFQNKVLAFIEKNYANSQLSVSMIAEYMGLNPTYLSNVFSQRQGVSLLDSIMRYRVQKAKELFDKRDGSTVDEVAGRVGYDSRHTFVRIFKKYEGVTPTQYLKANEIKGLH